MSMSGLENTYERELLSVMKHAPLPGSPELPPEWTGTVGCEFAPVDAAFVTEIKGKPEQADAPYFMSGTASTPSESEWQSLVFAQRLRSGEGGRAPDAINTPRGPAPSCCEAVRHQANAFQSAWRIRTARQRAQVLASMGALASTARFHQSTLSAVQQKLTVHLAAFLSVADQLNVEQTRTAGAIKHFSVPYQESHRTTRAQIADALGGQSEFAGQGELSSATAGCLGEALGTMSRSWATFAEAAHAPPQIDRMVEQVKLALGAFADLCSSAKGSLPSSVAFAEGAERQISQLVEEGRVRKARELLQHALAVYPESVGLKGWQKVLARPTVRRVKGARARSRHLEYEWLKQHGREHQGQWVALGGDRLLSAGPKLADVISQARASGEAADPLVHFIPEQRTERDG